MTLLSRDQGSSKIQTSGSHVRFAEAMFEKEAVEKHGMVVPNIGMPDVEVNLLMFRSSTRHAPGTGVQKLH